MATYFHGNSEIQSAASGADGLQTLVLMNHAGYNPYADTPPPPPSSAAGNLVFLHSAAASLSHHHAPPQHHHQHFGHGTNEITAFHPGFLPQRVHYNLWTPPPDTPSPSARDTPRTATPHQQGLSLTLSSQQIGFGSSHAPASGEDARVVSGGSSAVSGVTNGGGGGVGVAGIQSVLLSSKYLKAAQELLEEVVNVGAGIGAEAAGKKGGSKAAGESPGVAVSGEGSGGGGGGGDGNGKRPELTPAERQEVQMKKAKLINMLDEVEQRYRQYHQQMQIVISSFEQVAGMGSARTYTALALQTISKQFRCLKDAIGGQIRATNKSLGEEESLGKAEGSSRLKFVDHHLRQQRALQQLGMIQHNAWRPQRGLPERSVSVLRAWLFEHFLHPYPKDSDKHMLAKQTGLTRSQVSNWFINARVRLWKPMVEEMYLEEVKENETNNPEKPSKSTDTDSKSNEKSPASAASHQPVSLHQQFAASPSPPGGTRTHNNNHHISGFSLVSSELEGITAQSSPKKARCDGDMLLQPSSIMGMDVKPGKVSNITDHISMGRDGYSFMGGSGGGGGGGGGQTNFIGGFGQYPIADIGRFDATADQFTPRFSSGNGVSLTLGLPHCDNTNTNTHLHHLSLAGAHQSFVPNQAMQLGTRRVDHSHHHQHHHHLSIGEAANEFGDPHSSSSSAAFETINNHIQNPKRFAAQLLPDYVS